MISHKRQGRPQAECLTMSVLEASRLLGIHRITAARLVKEGELPAIKVGGQMKVLKAPLLAMLGQAA